MTKKNLKSILHLCLLGLISLQLSGCVDSSSLSNNRKSKIKAALSENAEGDESRAENVGDNGAGPFDGSFTGSTDVNLNISRVELRHLVDPGDGTYKTKVTIPKNFSSTLYISGLNVTSLSDRLITVRFRFGREQEKIDIPAVIGRAPGITPQTDIEVLQLDFKNKPFQNLRLLYDLYDYSDYDSDGDGIEDFRDTNNQISGPTQEPRDSSLYCRGLALDHDPTFKGSATNSKCDAAGEKCLYAYAKVLDSGLVSMDTGTDIALVPETPQIDFSKNGYIFDSEDNNLEKCLPDNNNLANLKATLGALSIGANGSSLFHNDLLTMPSGTTYKYQGPFRTVGESDWAIQGEALFSKVSSSVEGTGLFQESYSNLIPSQGYNSFLFPREAKLNLIADVEYFGSVTPGETKTLTKLITSGESQFMNGCNYRVSNYDKVTGEGVHSCNITATIELITTDKSTGQEVSLLRVPESTLKLQVVRASLTNFRGEEVLFTSLKNCKNNNACGSSECCFNERCWGRELVSQCLEDREEIGQRQIGEICISDLQCSSLCCNSSTGACAVHQNIGNTPVLCSKSPGQSCLTREFCRLENIQTCFIVKTTKTATGVQECALRCYNTPTFGNCRNGTCLPPSLPPVPSFDSTNPDCSSAIEPPLINATGEAIPTVNTN